MKQTTELSDQLTVTSREISQILSNAKEVKLSLYEKKIETLGVQSTSLVVASEDGMKAATDLAMQLKGIGDDLDKRRKELKAPGANWASAVDDAFQPLIKMANSFVVTLRGKASLYQQRLLEEREAKERKARAEAERIRLEAEKKQREADEKAAKLRAEAEALKRKDAAKAAELLKKAEHVESVASRKSQYADDQANRALDSVQQAPATTTSSSGKTATAKEKWAFEIINREAVPMDYWEINEAMIQSVIDAQAKSGLEPSIPGCRCFKRASVAFGGR